MDETEGKTKEQNEMLAKAFDEGAKAREESVYWYGLINPPRTAGAMHQIRFQEIKNKYRKEEA
jgi:hypothetical protein